MKFGEILKQPSTYAGVGILSMSIPALMQAWATKGDIVTPFMTVFAGLVSVFAPERGPRQ